MPSQAQAENDASAAAVQSLMQDMMTQLLFYKPDRPLEYIIS